MSNETISELDLNFNSVHLECNKIYVMIIYLYIWRTIKNIYIYVYRMSFKSSRKINNCKFSYFIITIKTNISSKN